MKDKKKYICAVIVLVTVLLNLVFTARLVFSVLYPERMLREAVSDYFKESLDKAVKFEALYIDSTGNIIIRDFEVSITSDFNDNISLVRSSRAVIDLSLPDLLGGAVTVSGIEFYGSEITILKKYGRSHLESFEQVFSPSRFLRRTMASRPDFYLHVHNARVLYRESLHDRQVTLELDRVDAVMDLSRTACSYAADGAIRPYKSAAMRKGSFSVSGTVDLGKGDAFSHRVNVDNFDLTYLNEHIAEHRVAPVTLEGGGSVDLEIARSKGAVLVRGTCETGNLTLFSIERKHGMIMNENLDCELDITYRPASRSLTARKVNLRDDTFSIESSGSFADNDRVKAIQLTFRTNAVDLGDLSRNFSPYPDIEYEGTLQCEGRFFLDLKKNSAAGTKVAASVNGFRVLKSGRDGESVLIDPSVLSLRLTDKDFSLDLAAKPLNSDLQLTARTSISNWVPLRSDTKVVAVSRRMNLENLKNLVFYLVDKANLAAINDKRGGTENVPFSRKPLGRFLNNSTIDVGYRADAVFYGRGARWNDFTFGARLERGALLVRDFGVEGYGATYRLAGQAYFNSDQPYIKLDGKVDGFDFGGFYRDSGMQGSAGGTARGEFSFEVSVARIGDMLDNAKGHLNVYIGKGTMADTKLQQALARFFKKNGYDADRIATINYDDITFGSSQQGENYWFNNLSIRGDTFLFTAGGDYMYESGISSTYSSATIRSESSVTAIPLKLSGPVLAPCLEVLNRKDSQKACF